MKSVEQLMNERLIRVSSDMIDDGTLNIDRAFDFFLFGFNDGEPSNYLEWLPEEMRAGVLAQVETFVGLSATTPIEAYLWMRPPEVQAIQRLRQWMEKRNLPFKKSLFTGLYVQALSDAPVKEEIPPPVPHNGGRGVIQDD